MSPLIFHRVPPVRAVHELGPLTLYLIHKRKRKAVKTLFFLSITNTLKGLFVISEFDPLDPIKIKSTLMSSPLNKVLLRFRHCVLNTFPPSLNIFIL